MSDHDPKRTPEMSDDEYLALCRQYGIAEAGTFPSSREAAAAYPDDFVWDLGDGLTMTNAELGYDRRGRRDPGVTAAGVGPSRDRTRQRSGRRPGNPWTGATFRLRGER